MAKVGRPKKTIETERILYVIPKEIKEELDKRINPCSSDEDYKDRSKLITKAVKEMLGLGKKIDIERKKRKFENIYSKLFIFTDKTLENHLFKPLNSESNNFEIVNIVDKLREKIISGQELSSDEINSFNDILKELKFCIDKNLNVISDSEYINVFLFQLQLNKHYPISNYLGICNKCNRLFFKRKLRQKFCSPSCKIKYYSTKKINKSNNINTNYEIHFSDYNNIKGGELQRWKKIIIDCWNLCFNKYSKFKELISFKDDKNRTLIYRSIIILMTEINSILLEKELNFLENITVDILLNWFVEEIFPKECSKKIKTDSIKDLKKYIPLNRFAIEKELYIALKKYKIDNNNEYINNLYNYKNYFESNFEQDYQGILPDEAIKDAKKMVLLQYDCLLAIRKYDKHQIDECIDICNNILKTEPSHIDAHGLLILALFDKKDFNKIIEHYTELEKISFGLHFIDYNLIKIYSAIAFNDVENNEKALEILKSEEDFNTNELKIMRELTLFRIYLDVENIEKARNCLKTLKELEEKTDKIDKIEKMEKELKEKEAKFLAIQNYKNDN